MTRFDIEVALVMAVCQKYSRSLHSMCKKPEEYGIKRTAGAEAALGRPKADKRIKTGKYTARLTEAKRAVFEQAREEDGYSSFQSWFEGMVDLYLEARV